MPAIDLITPDLIPNELRQIIERAPLAGLDNAPKCSKTRAAIEDWRQASPRAGTLVESGLWLLAGELDRSHVISQSTSSAEGSFWHGIMHRREGDFGNSKYWFRRMGGTHPVHQQLVTLIEQRQSDIQQLPVTPLLELSTFPAKLVDMCQTALEVESAWQTDLQQICWWEWQLLFSRDFL